MRTLITDLFGSYVPITYTSYVSSSDGTLTSIDVIPSGAAGVDWEWLAGVLLFALTFFCVFRIVGSLLKNA